MHGGAPVKADVFPNATHIISRCRSLGILSGRRLLHRGRLFFWGFVQPGFENLKTPTTLLSFPHAGSRRMQGGGRIAHGAGPLLIVLGDLA
jgi:hypothetical protein